MILLLDDFHLGDPLFATALARDLKARGAGAVVVHGSAEAGERALEAAGAWPEANAGVWRVATEAQAEAVERATRELNRRLVHELNEAGVPVVGAVASARGLVKRDGDGRVAAGRTAWASTLMGQGGVIVLASLVESSDGAALREVDPAQTAAALADALGTAVLVLTTARADGLPGAGGETADALSLDAALATERLADGALVTRLVGLGAPVQAVSAASMRRVGSGAEAAVGTWIGDRRPPGGVRAPT